MAENRFTDPAAKYFTGMSTEPIPAPPPSTQLALESTLDLIRIHTDNIPPLGQALMSGSIPVVIASDQTPLPISGVVTAVIPNPLPVSQSGAWSVTANIGTTGALALEAGNLATIAAKDFATQTTLALIKAKTDNIDVALSTRTKPADQQHVIIDSGSVTAVVPNPLPVSQSGAWTVTANAGTNLNTSLLALEAGGNLATIAAKDFATQTTLALIKAKTDNIPPLGQALAASSVPVVLTVAQLSTLTPLTTVAVTQSGNWSTRTLDGSGNAITSTASALDVNIKSGVTLTVDLDHTTDSVTVYGSQNVALQQKVTTNDLIITLDGEIVPASQSGVWSITNISGTVSLPTGASTEATLALIKAKTDNIPPLGQALAAASVPVVLTAAQLTALTPLSTVAVTQSGAWTVTANAGTNLNTSALLLDATFTARINTQGQKAMAASTPVVIASDQSAIPIYGTITTTPSGTQDTNVKQVNGVTTQTGTGVAGTGTIRVAVASDSSIILAAGTAEIGNVKNSGTFAVQAAQSGAWTVTANAGTNLNTSLLALEAGGNLATIAGKDFATQTTLALIKSKTDNIPALGQALAAASVPVVLTAAQITTLTPLSTVAATQSGAWTVTANAGTNLNTSLLALEAGGNLATVKTNTDNLALAQASTTSGQKANLILGAVTTAAPTYTTAQSNPLSLTTTGLLRVDGSGVTQTVSGTVSITANSAVNVAQMNGVTVTMGNGVAGTGVQRVAIASDNTAFSVNATLTAETTKVIGVVRNADGSGNLLTSTSNALDVNLKTSALSNLSVNVAQMNGVAVSMGSGVTGTGVQRVTLATDVALPAGTNLLGKVGIDQTTPGTTNATVNKGLLSSATHIAAQSVHSQTVGVSNIWNSNSNLREASSVTYPFTNAGTDSYALVAVNIEFANSTSPSFLIDVDPAGTTGAGDPAYHTFYYAIPNANFSGYSTIFAIPLLYPYFRVYYSGNQNDIITVDTWTTNQNPSNVLSADINQKTTADSTQEIYNIMTTGISSKIIYNGAVWTYPSTSAGASNSSTLRTVTASDSPEVTAIGLLNLAQNSTTSGQTGPLIQGAVTTAAPSYTTAKTSPLSLDTAGNLRTTTTIPGTVDTELPAAAALADTTANPTAPLVGACLELWNGTTWDRAKAATLFDYDTGGAIQNIMGVGLRSPASGGSIELLPTSATLSDSLANPITTLIGSTTLLYNGSTWERAVPVRNALNSTGVGIEAVGIVAQLDDVSPTAITENQFGPLRMSTGRGLHNNPHDSSGNELIYAQDVTLLASAARTTTQTSADQINYAGCSSLIVVLDMTTVGTGSVTVTIDGKDVASGKYYNILTGAAITTNSTNRYRIGRNVTAAANSIAQDYLPKTFRVVVTANNANSATYSLGYSLVN